jgi:drug/metabolite transporter (DMT)-like permease
MNPDASHRGEAISIWFFIGICLLVDGVLILGAGVYELIQPRPLEARVVLFQYHASVWWGAMLAALGAFYCRHFAPSRTHK